MYSTITCNYLSAPFLHWCDVKCGFTFLEKTAMNKLLSLNPISCPFASPFEPSHVAFLRLSIPQTSDQRRLAIRPAPLQERPLCRCVQITVISCLKWRPLEARRRTKQRGLTCKPTYAHTRELWETLGRQMKHLSQKLDLRYRQCETERQGEGKTKNCPVAGSDTRKRPLTNREKGNNSTFSVLTCPHKPISLYLQSGIRSAHMGPCRSVIWPF